MKPVAAVAYSFAGSVTLGVLCHFNVAATLEDVPVGLDTQARNLPVPIYRKRDGHCGHSREK